MFYNIWDETLIRKFKVICKKITSTVAVASHNLTINYYNSASNSAANVIFQDSDAPSGVAVDFWDMDADNDGFHIRNLLMTYFLNDFEELVVAGRVHILETPLYRVRNKKRTQYCYNIKERDVALKEISNAEVTRFKGLGEISPKEFGQFIGDNMRLVSVNIKTLKNIHETMQFYMGKNTPERREYIMENLV